MQKSLNTSNIYIVSLFIYFVREHFASATLVHALCGKVSKYGVFSGPYFPVFGLNTKIYSINLRI